MPGAFDTLKEFYSESVFVNLSRYLKIAMVKDIFKK